MAANEDIVRQAIVGSPLASLLGAETVEVAPDCVRVRLPFRAELTTVGELVHGGVGEVTVARADARAVAQALVTHKLDQS